MDTRTIDRLFAALLVLLGIHIVWNAVGYGYMRGTTPGAGFFPFWVGLALIGLSAANLTRSLRGTEQLDTEFDPAGLFKTLGIIGAAVAFIVLTPALGMLLAGGLLIPATAFVIRPRWTIGFACTIGVVTVLFPVLCHVLFGVYLRVPLVTGVLGF